MKNNQIVTGVGVQKWLLGFLIWGAAVPANAQWFPMGPVEPETPAAPAPPIPEADISDWLKQLTLEVQRAEKAHVEKDFEKRDAAIIEVAKWSEKLLAPHEVSQANRLKTFDIIAPFARRMIEWKSYFPKGSMTYSGVRLSTFIGVAKGADLAKMLIYKADLKSAEDYAVLAFDDYKRVLEIPEADPALVKHASIRCINEPTNSERSYLKPIYARLLTLPLTPAEQKEWKVKQQLYIIDVDYKGEEYDAAMKAVKALIDDQNLPLAQRHDMAGVYAEEFFGDEKKAFIEQMIGATKANPSLVAEWTFKRGATKTQDKKWAEAVADYRVAAKLAPAGSAQRDKYVSEVAFLTIRQLNTTKDVLPELEAIVKSNHLTLDERFEAALWLQAAAVETKDYELAKARLITARTIAGDDIHLVAKANVFLARAQMELGQLEEALATWSLIPTEKLSYTGQSPLRKGIKAEVSQFASAFYNKAATAKKFALAQTIIDKSRKDSLFGSHDYTLLEIDLLARQGKFDDAISKMKTLEVLVITDQDKAAVRGMLANLEKMKAEQVKPN